MLILLPILMQQLMLTHEAQGDVNQQLKEVSVHMCSVGGGSKRKALIFWGEICMLCVLVYATTVGQ